MDRMKKEVLLSLLLLPAVCFCQTPAFDWVVTSQNCAAADNSKAVVTDAAGNSYITGRFVGTADLDPGTGVANITTGPNGSFYVARYDAGGNYVWGIPIVTTTSCETEGIALDANGNVIICGFLQGSGDFDPGVGIQTLTANGSSAFVAKYDANGNYVWAFTMDATSSSACTSVQTDAAGDIYVTGYFNDSLDFDPGVNTFYLSTTAQEHAYIAKYSSAGTLVFALPIGGTTGSSVIPQRLAVSSAGSLAICGSVLGTADFDPGTGVQSFTANPGNYDIFTAQYDAAGNFQWANVFGSAGNFSSANDYGRGVCFDAAGNVIVSGQFQGTVDFDPTAGTQILTAIGDADAFIAKYSSAGLCQWAFHVGGTTVAYAIAVCTDAAGNIYTIGTFENTVDFDPGTPVKNLIAAGTNLYDAFVASYTPTGTYRWAFSLSSPSMADVGYGIATRGNWVYATGAYALTVDFDPAVTTASRTYAGKYDLYLARYSMDASAVTENAGAFGFDLYPNPADENITVVLKNVTPDHLVIYNSLGTVVLERDVVTMNSTVSVASFVSGIYFCVVVDENGNAVTRRFAVEH